MTEPTDVHYYEPAQGHRLPHDPFNAIIGPRPIGWVSSRGLDGSLNLAPYSFFNAFNYTPPILGFASTTAKDSFRNARDTGEFVWNLTTRALAEAMNATCATVPYGTDEFALAGLTPAPSRLVKAPRVAESPVNFECKVTELVQLKSPHRRRHPRLAGPGRGGRGAHRHASAEGRHLRHLRRRDRAARRRPIRLCGHRPGQPLRHAPPKMTYSFHRLAREALAGNRG